MCAASRTAFVLGLAGLLALPTTSRADDAAALAEVLASPIFNTFEESQHAYDDTRIMLRMEIARQRLAAMTITDPDLMALRSSVLNYLENCHSSMEELRRLNGKVPDVEGLAKSTLNALPALTKDTKKDPLTEAEEKSVEDLVVKGVIEGFKAAINAWQASQEWENYRQKYRDARFAGYFLRDYLDTHCVAPRSTAMYGIGAVLQANGPCLDITEILPDSPAAAAGLRTGDRIWAVDDVSLADAGPVVDLSSAARLRGAQGSRVKIGYLRDGQASDVTVTRTLPIGEQPVLYVDLESSWDATFDSDVLILRNDSGQDLTNCTLAVYVQGLHGDSYEPNQDRHLHFMGRWPAGDVRYARYLATGAQGFARNESVDFIKRVTIDLYSDQLRNTINYDYADTDPAEFNKDIERYLELKPPQFKLSFNKNNIFADANVSLTHEECWPSIPHPYITVRVYVAEFPTTVRFDPRSRKWGSGGFAATTLWSKQWNDLDPDRVEVDLEFPGSSVSRTLNFQLK